MQLLQSAIVNKKIHHFFFSITILVTPARINILSIDLLYSLRHLYRFHTAVTNMTQTTYDTKYAGDIASIAIQIISNKNRSDLQDL